MNSEFIGQQKTLVTQRLEASEDRDARTRDELVIIAGYLSSLLHPDDYPEAQLEDFRKLALELGYTEDTDFHAWEAARKAGATATSTTSTRSRGDRR